MVRGDRLAQLLQRPSCRWIRRHIAMEKSQGSVFRYFPWYFPGEFPSGWKPVENSGSKSLVNPRTFSMCVLIIF